MSAEELKYKYATEEMLEAAKKIFEMPKYSSVDTLYCNSSFGWFAVTPASIKDVVITRAMVDDFKSK